MSTAVGGIPAAVRSDETGWLVPPGDERALTTVLRRVFDGDEALRRMAQRGRAHALDKYSAEQMASTYLALYRECL